MIRVVVSLLATVVCLQPAFASNNYFFPGDAFFHTELTEAQLDRIDKEENPVFHYVRPKDAPISFCGYAGFGKLEYKAMPAAMKKNLRKLYQQLRETRPQRVEVKKEVVTQQQNGEDIEVPTGKKIYTEINGFSVMFYNADADFSKIRLGLKYNEDWVESIAAFGHKRKNIRLESFVNTAEGIIQDWRDAALVNPLNVVCPESSPKNLRKSIRPSKPLQAIVMPVNDFQKLFRGEEFGWGATLIYSVTADGIKALSSENGHWKEHKPLGGLGGGFKK